VIGVGDPDAGQSFERNIFTRQGDMIVVPENVFVP